MQSIHYHDPHGTTLKKEKKKKENQNCITLQLNFFQSNYCIERHSILLDFNPGHFDVLIHVSQ